jgi:hypothetical protein
MNSNIIIIIIILGLITLNIFVPLLITNFNKLLEEIKIQKLHKNELIKTDKIISNITSPKTTLKSINTLTEEFDGGDSVYRRLRLIDENGCYEPKFSLCEDSDTGNKGYKIFTPMQSNCLTADKHLNNYDAAFAQLDRYLNNIPYVPNIKADRREICINKPSVKNGITLFGLCNKAELTNRYCSLKDQKNDLADMNPGIEVSNLELGLSNMELLNSVCFPDSSINCEVIETTTTSS